MCYWITMEFEECNDSSHSYQLGVKCAEAVRNREWCDEDECTELDTENRSKIPDIKFPCARCKGIRVRFVDYP